MASNSLRSSQGVHQTKVRRNSAKLLVTTFLVGFIFHSISCQQLPTKVTVQEPLQSATLTAEDLRKTNGVIIDARPAFDFNMAHAPGAINIAWQDFSRPEPQAKGLLQNDTYAIARRLSLVGIDPETSVIVLGKGAAGAGEEGRIAWILKYLGVKSVYTLNVSAFRELNNNPNKQAPLVKNKPYWKPVLDENILVDTKIFKEKVAGDVFVIDVRSANEYALPQTVRGKWKTQKVYNIPWTEFFKKDGLVQASVQKKLDESGIKKTDEVILISNQGVRSGAVSFALKQLGYVKPMNFAGGYNQIN